MLHACFGASVHIAERAQHLDRLLVELVTALSCNRQALVPAMEQIPKCGRLFGALSHQILRLRGVAQKIVQLRCARGIEWLDVLPSVVADHQAVLRHGERRHLFVGVDPVGA